MNLSWPNHVVFCLLPDFSMICFASAIESMRLANSANQTPLFSWRICSPDGSQVKASNGIQFSGIENFQDLQSGETVFICAGRQVHKQQSPALEKWLARQNRRGVNLGAFSNGCHVLARAGLLDGYRCSVHWDYLDSFLEEFPDVIATKTIFEIDRNRFTCAGGTAPTDMLVALLNHCGHQRQAEMVVDEMVHIPVRNAADQQRHSLPARIGARHPGLVKAVLLMEENLEEPLSPGDLAKAVGISVRQLERLFRYYLACPPKQYYLQLRLQKARQLLLRTDMRVIEVAIACGFSSPSHFSKCYRDFFACHAPSRKRSDKDKLTPRDASLRKTA